MSSHDHDHHDHHHHNHPDTSRRLLLALLLTLGFAAVEAAGGLWAGSLALLGDAGHMLSDSFSLGLAAAAAWLARRPPSHRHSYGFGRVEVVAALLNALLMLAVVGGIAAAALDRLEQPVPVAGGTVMLVAAAGLGVNLLAAWVLGHGDESLNVRAALLHVLGDLLGSLAALVSGAVIYLTGWTVVDPVLALAVCFLILYSTLHLLRESVHVLLEGVPFGLELPEIGAAMARSEHVHSVHDLHVWALSSGSLALSAHVVLDDLRHWEQVLHQLTHLLGTEYRITHVTLQPETRTFVLRPMRRD